MDEFTAEPYQWFEWSKLVFLACAWDLQSTWMSCYINNECVHTAISVSIIKELGLVHKKRVNTIGKHLTSVRLAAADLADLFSALEPAMCRGMYQSRKWPCIVRGVVVGCNVEIRKFVNSWSDIRKQDSSHSHRSNAWHFDKVCKWPKQSLFFWQKAMKFSSSLLSKLGQSRWDYTTRLLFQFSYTEGE